MIDKIKQWFHRIFAGRSSRPDLAIVDPAERRQLFLDTLEDLRTRIASGNNHQVLTSAAVIRSLLYDATNPLADKVNVAPKLKIKYTYSNATEGEYYQGMLRLGMTTFHLGDGFYPPHAISNPEPIVTTSKDALFQTVVLMKDGRGITVKEVLDFVNYILGAVHHRNPKDRVDVTLLEMNKAAFFDTPAIVAQVKSIGHVVAAGLTDLEAKVRSRS